jgi:hypothetical protein
VLCPTDLRFVDVAGVPGVAVRVTAVTTAEQTQRQTHQAAKGDAAAAVIHARRQICMQVRAGSKDAALAFLERTGAGYEAACDALGACAKPAYFEFAGGGAFAERVPIDTTFFGVCRGGGGKA